MIITNTDDKAIVLAALIESRKAWLERAAEYGNAAAADAAERALKLLRRFDPKGEAKGRYR